MGVEVGSEPAEALDVGVLARVFSGAVESVPALEQPDELYGLRRARFCDGEAARQRGEVDAVLQEERPARLRVRCLEELAAMDAFGAGDLGTPAGQE